MRVQSAVSGVQEELIIKSAMRLLLSLLLVPGVPGFVPLAGEMGRRRPCFAAGPSSHDTAVLRSRFKSHASRRDTCVQAFPEYVPQAVSEIEEPVREFINRVFFSSLNLRADGR